MKSKQESCRFCYMFMGKDNNESHCVVDGRENDKVKTVSKEQCEKCGRFDSKFIEYPLTIQGIDNKEINTSGLECECGALCEISPCGKEYEGKSYIGIYLGHLPIDIITSYHRKTGILENRTMNNSAIFVPELKKIIYGCQSWWREIESVEDFKGISKEDIENTLKLLNMQQSITHYGSEWIYCGDGKNMPEEHNSMFAELKGTDKWNEAMFEKISDNVNVTVEYENGKRQTMTLYTVDGKWKTDRILKFKVIAWKPLPEPYHL